MKTERNTRGGRRTRRAISATLVALLAVAAAGSALAEPAPAGATVTASVVNLRSQLGSIGCRLINREESFPRGTAGTIRQSVRITGHAARCVFKAVPAGTYAMTVIHDENDNGKLDLNLLGMPTEGYGVSNNRTHATRAPVWEECKFAVERGKNRELAIALRY